MALVAVAVVATIASLLAAFRPSLSPPALHARGLQFSVAKAAVLVDTPRSNLRGLDQDTHDPPLTAETYALFLQTDVVRAAIGRAVGLENQDITASGPFTLLLGRSNLVQRLPSVPPNSRPANSGYRLVLDVDGHNPMLTLYSQAPTTRAAITIVNEAVSLLKQYVARRERAYQVAPHFRSVLRPLGPTTAGPVDLGASARLSAFVFVLVFVLGASLVLALEERRLRKRTGTTRARPQLDRLDDELSASDDWPRTTRVLPWTLALFMALIFLVPFDAVASPVHLPVDSTPDRLLLIALGMLWFSSLALLSGAARPRLKFTRVHFAALAFFGICCVGVALNEQALTSLQEIQPVLKKLVLLASFLIFFVIVASVVRPREVPRFAALMVGLGAIVGVAAVIEYHTQSDPFYALWGKLVPLNLPPELDARDSIGRLTIDGPTADPLELVALITVTLPFAVMGAIDARTRLRRLLYLLSLAALLAGGIATARKTAVIAPLAGVLVMLVYRPKAMLRWGLAMAVPLFVAVHLALPGTIGSLLAELEPGHASAALTTADRVSRYDAVRPDIASHLLLGRGFQGYDPHKYRILDNEYLALLIGVGLIGTFVYILIFAGLLSIAHPTIRGPDPRRASLALAASAAVAAVAASNALFDVLSFPHVPYLLFFIGGMILALREPSPRYRSTRVAARQPRTQPPSRQHVIRPPQPVQRREKPMPAVVGVGVRLGSQSPE